MDHSVSCRQLENFQIQVATDNHSWVVDEPRDAGGDDLGPNPFEVLLGSLGSCMLITICNYAANAGIPVEHLSADIAGEWQETEDEREYHIAIRLLVRGELEQEDVQRLDNAADRCPVHGLLSRATEIEHEIELV